MRFLYACLLVTIILVSLEAIVVKIIVPGLIQPGAQIKLLDNLKRLMP